MRRSFNPSALQMLGILTNLSFVVATAYIIAKTVKQMDYAAAHHDFIGIDGGTAQLATFVCLSVLLGGMLAALVVLYRRPHHDDEIEAEPIAPPPARSAFRIPSVTTIVPYFVLVFVLFGISGVLKDEQEITGITSAQHAQAECNEQRRTKFFASFFAWFNGLQRVEFESSRLSLRDWHADRQRVYKQADVDFHRAAAIVCEQPTAH